MSERIHMEPSHRQVGHVDKREAIDLLRSRISLLEGRDRLIMKMYYDNGASTGQIAALMGVSTSTVARRIKTLSKRLIAQRYRSCTRNSHRLNSDELEIARDHFVRGLSLRSMAARRDCSFYRIREIVRKVKLVADGGANSPAVKSASHAAARGSEGVT